MPVSEQDKDFLKYAIKNLEKGENTEIPYSDRNFFPGSKYITNKHKTWGDLYSAAEAQFKAKGGNQLEIGKLRFGPGYKPTAPAPIGVDASGGLVTDTIGRLIREQNLSVSTDANGNTTLNAFTKDENGKVTQALEEHFIYVDTVTDASGKKLEQVNVSSDYDLVAQKAITSYQTSPGGINSLFDSLYKKNLITKETYNSKNISAPDFRKGLQYAIRQYSISTVDARRFNQTITVGTFGDYLSSNALPGTGGVGGTSTDIRRQETTRPDSDEEANRFAMENIGRNATKEEKDAYFAVLNAAEKKAVVKSTTTTGTSSRSGVDSGSFIDQTDKTLMLGKIFASSIEGSDLDTIVKSGAGAAQDINNIKTYAKRYGINYTDEQAMAQVVSNLKSGKDLSSTRAKIQKLSKIKYGNLADFIDDDTSVEEIASEAIYKVSQLTGIPYKSLSVNNPVVAKAIANNGKPGVMTESEISYLVKTDPETKGLWLKTPAAKEEASGYANDILRMFGLRA
jgi:hypothetical protein